MITTARALVTLLGILALPSLPRLAAQTFDQELLASDPSDFAFFGVSAALNGSDLLVIGAPVANGVTNDTGAAYVFRDDAPWVQEIKLTASDGSGADNLGRSVGLSGSLVIAGAPGDDSFKGSAYVFRRNSSTSWTQEAKLTYSTGATADQFGWASGIVYGASESLAVVGAKFADPNGSSSGLAIAFVRNSSGTWSQEATILGSDTTAGDEFGTAVAQSGRKVVIGAPGVGDDAGAAYVFSRSGGSWTQEAKLTPDDGASNDKFGWSVAMSGDRVVVGSPFHNLGSSADAGKIYVYKFTSGSGWAQEARLTADSPAADSWFGSSVGITSRRIVAGSSHYDSPYNDGGAAYTFFLDLTNGWEFESHLTAPDEAASDSFGTSAAVDAYRLVVGSQFHDETNTAEGAAYTFVP